MAPDVPGCVVVDTNVLAVAEGLHPEASLECVAACTALARQIQQGRVRPVVDSENSGRLVFAEYLRVLKDSHLSGLGSKLAISLWHQHWDEGICRTMDITPCDEPEGSFDEVPEVLKDFDLDDHKWMAVAVAEGSNPMIFQALDEQWWARSDDFATAGLNVQFLCAADLIETLGPA